MTMENSFNIQFIDTTPPPIFDFPVLPKSPTASSCASATAAVTTTVAMASTTSPTQMAVLPQNMIPLTFSSSASSALPNIFEFSHYVSYPPSNATSQQCTDYIIAASLNGMKPMTAGPSPVYNNTLVFTNSSASAGTLLQVSTSENIFSLGNICGATVAVDTLPLTTECSEEKDSWILKEMILSSSAATPAAFSFDMGLPQGLPPLLAHQFIPFIDPCTPIHSILQHTTDASMPTAVNHAVADNSEVQYSLMSLGFNMDDIARDSVVIQNKEKQNKTCGKRRGKRTAAAMHDEPGATTTEETVGKKRRRNSSIPCKSRAADRSKEPEGEDLIMCPYPGCGKTFTRRYNLKSHERTHTNERPFECDTCEAKFSRNHDLKRHRKIHTGIKPFVCGHCQHRFARADALRRHTQRGGNIPVCKKGKLASKKSTGAPTRGVMPALPVNPDFDVPATDL